MTKPSPSAPDLVLYHFPGACSQVCVFALEHAGLRHELRLVDLAADEQSEASYAAISPLGKVPALAIDGAVLTENAAILTYVSALRPEVGLFPARPTPLMAARQQAGLSFCGGGLHPIVRGLANPQRLTDGDPEGVRSKATQLARKSFAYAEARLAATGWWLDSWSLVDVYLRWTVSVAQSKGFDFGLYPHLESLKARLEHELPAFRRMLEIDAESHAVLARRRTA